MAAAWAGLMIGDALGAPAEFCHHDDIMVKYPDGIQDMVPGFGIYTDRRPGEVTDDTQMAYCLHLALQDANVLFVHTMLTAMQPGITAQEIFQSAKFFILKKKLSRALYCAILYRRFPPDYDGEHIGWLRVALQGIFHQMLYAASFREAMIDVVSAGGDTDTNAAITGALLGAWKGIDCLDRSWLAAVHAANPRHYTKLLPTIRSLPCTPIRLDEPVTHYTHRTSGIILPFD